MHCVGDRSRVSSLQEFLVKTAPQAEGSKRRRKKTAAAKRKTHTVFIGTRPRTLSMMLRGQLVDVEVVPAVGSTTHVNYEITISRAGKVLDWVPTRAELEHIGRTAAIHTEQETSH
jgi:hypothetical protein